MSEIVKVTADVADVVARAEALQVTTPAEALEATAFLAEIKAAKTRSERARTFIVGPLNEQVKRINAEFKNATTPLAAADHLLRGKVVRFHQEQQRTREREQARLDADRQQAEEKAAAERQKAEEEARRLEREARETERQRKAAAEEQDERHRRITGATDEALRLIAANRLHPDCELAREEFAARQAAHDAQQRAEQARQEAEEATQHSIAVQAAPSIQVATPRLANGTVGVRRWKATIIDEDQVPREYMVPDMRKINAAVRAGTREIPGVRVEQVDGLAVRGAR